MSYNQLCTRTNRCYRSSIKDNKKMIYDLCLKIVRPLKSTLTVFNDQQEVIDKREIINQYLKKRIFASRITMKQFIMWRVKENVDPYRYTDLKPVNLTLTLTTNFKDPFLLTDENLHQCYRLLSPHLVQLLPSCFVYLGPKVVSGGMIGSENVSFFFYFVDRINSGIMKLREIILGLVKKLGNSYTYRRSTKDYNISTLINHRTVIQPFMYFRRF